ncbi:DUF3617 domain-containing protein [Allosphingosinicella sp.]|jgi:hypothetical protein|uniref:DUF3617 domain-containing protein n=1 Tax=Allosphingosinicella sp. TaxID=2823234 RepID=UPI002EF50319
MRLLILVPLAALASCGAEEKAKAPPKPDAIEAGQWETNLEVTMLRPLDRGTPKLNLPTGTRLTGSTCVAPADTSRPPATLFAVSPFECEYTNFYMKRGRLNFQMTCRHPMVDGEVATMLDGSFTAGEISGVINFSTALVSDGDVIVATRLTGRRIGACTPAAGTGANESSPSNESQGEER